MGRVVKHLCAIVLAAQLAASPACSSLLAPKAPDSMPQHTRAVYNEIRGAGRRNSSMGYATAIDVGTGKDRFNVEIIVNEGNWEAYVHLPEDKITLRESAEGVMGWLPGREPLEEGQSRAMYREHMAKTAEAVDKEGVGYPYEQGTTVKFLNLEGRLPF